MTKLHLAADLALPVDAVTEAIGFLGRRGSGKSYAAQRLAEEFHRANAQFIALDPVGNWWALRLAANGTDPGIAIPVFGGLHGDVPLEPTAGALIADVIVDRGISAVIDVSQFESDAEKARFARAFCERFYFRKKSSPSAVHLFLEEAQEFVPQNPTKDEPLMLHAFTRVAKLGRNCGIGISLISQRPQEVNKKVLNLAELLFVFQLTGVHERKAVEAWISDKGVLGQDIHAELPKIERGRPHAWSPGWLKISRIVGISKKWTYDASSTPKVGAHQVEQQPLAPIDIEKLRSDMAATIERAKAEDPKELRKEIALLKAQLTRAQKANGPPDAGRIDPAAIDAAIGRALAKRDREIEAWNRRRAQTVVGVAGTLEKAGAWITQSALDLRQLAELSLPAIATNGNGAAKAVVSVSSNENRSRTREQKPRTNPGETLPIGERKILTAAAQYPDGVSGEQLTILTGYKRSSRDAYVLRLRNRGYVEGGSDRLQATSAGVHALGDDFAPLPTGNDLQDYWRNRLTGGELAIFEASVAAWPHAVDRESLGETTEYKRSSRDAYIQRLKSRKVITVGREGVRASDILFDA